MKKHLTLLLLSSILLSCGGDEGEATGPQVQGWHFQGRNCLACHNVDLKPERHLLIAGTVFKSATASDPDDMSQVCGGELHLQLLDGSYNVVFDSRNYKDPNSRGYRGKGNVFVLKRVFPDVTPGDYYVRIIDSNGTTLAQSTTLHAFTSILGFDPRENPTDPRNRFSCNACHRYPNPQGGAPGFIYPQFNPHLCR